MSKQRNTFGMIRYWFRTNVFGLGGKGIKKTLSWKRSYNADRRKACKELEKAF